MTPNPTIEARKARMARWERIAVEYRRVLHGPSTETYTRGTVVSDPSVWKDSLNPDSMTPNVGHNVARDRKSEAVFE